MDSDVDTPFTLQLDCCTTTINLADVVVVCWYSKLWRGGSEVTTRFLNFTRSQQALVASVLVQLFSVR